MGLLKRVFVWFAGFIAVAWAGGAFLNSYVNWKRDQNHRAYEQDIALDRGFQAKAPTPLQVDAMLSTSHGGYQVPADLPSFHAHIAFLGKLPAIIVLPSCGFAVQGKNVPKNVVVLDVYEDPSLLSRKTSLEACVSSDDKSLEYALNVQLRYALDYVRHADWIDRNRVMIVGLGEAAPVVAAYNGPARQRLTLGSPCLVRWSTISRDTPMTMLFTSDHQGLTEENGPRQSVDIAAIARAAGPTFPTVRGCVGYEQLSIPAPVREVTAQGRLGIFDMPAALEAVQRTLYQEL